MELAAAGLKTQPFRIHGKPLVFVSYEEQQRAHAFLHEVASHPTGLGLLQGPALSGKTTLIRSFVASLDSNIEVAVVDCAGLDTTAFLEHTLHRFGYRFKFNSVNELLNMLKVYVLQRTASGKDPLLITENTQAMNPNALQVLCDLAELRVRQKSALRMVLVSDRSIESIMQAPAMSYISSRLTEAFTLGPMTEYETTDYLHEKLRAGGSADPESVIPEIVCDEFHIASGGWPGVLDRLVLLALAKADRCPLSREYIEYPALPGSAPRPVAAIPIGEPADKSGLDGPPRLFLTRGGETLGEIPIERSRLIVGRSTHNDLHIDSKFISRHHAMFIRHGKTTFLMDLNSTNGTFVNSRRISNQVLMHNDIISLGNHRVKFVHPAATDQMDLGGAGMVDTVILKGLQDMRRILAQENTQALPVIPKQSASD